MFVNEIDGVSYTFLVHLMEVVHRSFRVDCTAVALVIWR